MISGTMLIIVGFAIRKTGYFRWTLFIAVPLWILALGLMIYFRHPGQSVGYLIMCQVFIAISGGAMSESRLIDLSRHVG